MGVTKRTEVHVGDIWTATVNGNPTRVRIDRDHGYDHHRSYFSDKPIRHQGWDATNLNTNKKIHIRTAARLRNLISGLDGGNRKLTNRILGKIVLSDGKSIR